MMPDYLWITPEGHKLDKRTLNMWNEAERILGVQIPIMQGEYNPGKVSASAGAHDKGGAVDGRAKIKGVKTLAVVKALRRVGFAAWHRLPSQGPWPEHIHAVAIGNNDLSYVAKNQADAYLAGYNGLGHLGRGGKDDGPRDVVQTWEQYKKKHPKRFPPKSK
jgi:hypothetical protein